jgi:hypothetical protein
MRLKHPPTLPTLIMLLASNLRSVAGFRFLQRFPSATRVPRLFTTTIDTAPTENKVLGSIIKTTADGSVILEARDGAQVSQK